MSNVVTAIEKRKINAKALFLHKRSREILAGIGIAMLLMAPSATNGQETSSPEAAIAQREARSNARIGVAIIDPSKNRRFEYRGQERFLMCSTFKTLAVAAVLKRVEENKDKLDRFVPYGEAQLLEYAPVTRAHVNEGGMTLEALCEAATRQSDNTAANLLLETIGGPKAWTEFARAIGDDVSHLDRMEPELNNAADGDERDTTSPSAMCRDLERVFASDLLGETSRTRLEQWMQRNETGLKMIRATLPPDWKIGDKTGRSGKGATNDIAIVRPPDGRAIFVTIYTVDSKDSSEERDELVAEVAKIAINAVTR